MSNHCGIFVFISPIGGQASWKDVSNAYGVIKKNEKQNRTLDNVPATDDCAWLSIIQIQVTKLQDGKNLTR